MDKQQFKTLIRECVEEVLVEELNQEPLYVEYDSQRQGEQPFMLNGTKYEYVNAKYPNGKIDIGVYSFGEDLVYSFNAFRSRNNIKESITIKAPKPSKVRKNWGDMNPVSRIHGQGKQSIKPKYDRKKDQNWKNDLDEVISADPGGFVVDELNTLFQSGKVEITTDEIDNIALSHIKDVNQALNYAEKVGWDIAEKNGYIFDENRSVFIKNQTVQEMTTTGAVQGFMGKNWVDPDPKRTRIKNIAAKSVGGKVA